MLNYPLRFLHLRGNEKKMNFNDAVSLNWYQIEKIFIVCFTKGLF